MTILELQLDALQKQLEAIEKNYIATTATHLLQYTQNKERVSNQIEQVEAKIAEQAQPNN